MSYFQRARPTHTSITRAETSGGSIIARVWADLDTASDRLEGLSRIGIYEIS